jgi:hypothetical protein
VPQFQSRENIGQASDANPRPLEHQKQKTPLQQVLEEPNFWPTFKDQAQEHQAGKTVDHRESESQAIPTLAHYSPLFPSNDEVMK